jgi:hypothetical protein
MRHNCISSDIPHPNLLPEGEGTYRLLHNKPARLQLEESGVNAAFFPEQRLVRAFLDDASLVEDQYPVGVEDGREAVGDHDGGAAMRERVQRILNGAFAGGVERACGLVENKDGAVTSRIRTTESLYGCLTQ